MSQFVVDKDAFFRRVRLLYSCWKARFQNLKFHFHFNAILFSQKEQVESLANLSKCDAIVLMIGEDNDVLYCKSTAFQVLDSPFYYLPSYSNYWLYKL